MKCIVVTVEVYGRRKPTGCQVDTLLMKVHIHTMKKKKNSALLLSLVTGRHTVSSLVCDFTCSVLEVQSLVRDLSLFCTQLILQALSIVP